MTGPTFNAGRDIKGAFATGAGAVATATFTEAAPPDPTIDIRAAIAALRDELAQMPGIERKALNRLDEAQDEAVKPEPKREEVKNLVAQATSYASQATGFAEAAEKLKPHIVQIAGWLGTAWQLLAPR